MFVVTAVQSSLCTLIRLVFSYIGVTFLVCIHTRVPSPHFYSCRCFPEARITARRAKAEPFTRTHNHEDFTSHLATMDVSCTTPSVDAVSTGNNKLSTTPEPMKENSSAHGLISDNECHSDAHGVAQASEKAAHSSSIHELDVTVAESRTGVPDHGVDIAQQNTNECEALSSTIVSNSSGETSIPARTLSAGDEYILSGSDEDIDCDVTETETEQSRMQASQSTSNSQLTSNCSTHDSNQKADALFESEPKSTTPALVCGVLAQHHHIMASSVCASIPTADNHGTPGVNSEPREEGEICLDLEVNIDGGLHCHKERDCGNQTTQAGRNAHQLLTNCTIDCSDVLPDGAQKHSHLDDSTSATWCTVRKSGCEQETSEDGEYFLSDSDEEMDCDESDTEQFVKCASQSSSKSSTRHGQTTNTLVESAADVPFIEGNSASSIVRAADEDTETTVTQTVGEDYETTVTQTVGEDYETTVTQTVGEDTETTVTQIVGEDTETTVTQTVGEDYETTVMQTVGEDTETTVGEDTETTVTQTVGQDTETPNDVLKCIQTTEDMAPKTASAAGKNLYVSCGDQLTGAATEPGLSIAQLTRAVIPVTPLPVKKKPSIMSTGSQTSFPLEPRVPRRTKDEAKDLFDDDEDFDFEVWFAKHARDDGTVSQHQIDLEVLKLKHESQRWMQNTIIHNLELQRHIYADLMRNTKTVRVVLTLSKNSVLYLRA